jgi:hypothetical protein
VGGEEVHQTVAAPPAEARELAGHVGDESVPGVDRELSAVHVA